MRIAIYGIGGLYNYGCEAIVRGTVEFVRRNYSNPHITYYSRNYMYDKPLAEELQIDIVSIERKQNIFRKAISKIIDIMEFPIVPFMKKEFKQITMNSDIVFSVGGDIYTIPEYLRKRKHYRYVNYLVEFGNYALKHNVKVIIYGASIGPFGDYEKAKQYYFNHLKKIHKIICREENTLEYLKKNEIERNVIFLPDPAYLVNDSTPEQTPKYIGINLSGLSLQEVYGGSVETAVPKVCKMIEEIHFMTKMPIMLIPHVLSPHTLIDNDYKFLERIYNEINDSLKENIMIVKPTSFIDTKRYIKMCRVIAAARMHCAVNAITVGTPAIFIAYSQKARGMCKFVYKNDLLCLSLNEIDSKLPKLIVYLLNEECKIRQEINVRVENIREIYTDYFDR